MGPGDWTTPLGSGGFSILGQALRGLSAEVEEAAKPEAIQKGTLAGSQVMLQADGTYAPLPKLSDWSEYGRVYNIAARNAATTQREIDAHGMAGELGVKYYADPDKFQQAWDQYTQTTADALPDEIKGAVQIKLHSIGIQARTARMVEAHQLDLKNQAKTVEAAFHLTNNQIATLIASGEDPFQATGGKINELRDNYDKLVSSAMLAKAVSPGDAIKFATAMTDTIYSAAAARVGDQVYKQTRDPAAASAAIDKFFDDKAGQYFGDRAHLQEQSLHHVKELARIATVAYEQTQRARAEEHYQSSQEAAKVQRDWLSGKPVSSIDEINQMPIRDAEKASLLKVRQELMSQDAHKAAGEMMQQVADGTYVPGSAKANPRLAGFEGIQAAIEQTYRSDADRRGREAAAQTEVKLATGQTVTQQDVLSNPDLAAAPIALAEALKAVNRAAHQLQIKTQGDEYTSQMQMVKSVGDRFADLKAALTAGRGGGYDPTDVDAIEKGLIAAISDPTIQEGVKDHARSTLESVRAWRPQYDAVYQSRQDTLANVGRGDYSKDTMSKMDLIQPATAISSIIFDESKTDVTPALVWLKQTSRLSENGIDALKRASTGGATEQGLRKAIAYADLASRDPKMEAALIGELGAETYRRLTDAAQIIREGKQEGNYASVAISAANRTQEQALTKPFNNAPVSMADWARDYRSIRDSKLQFMGFNIAFPFSMSELRTPTDGEVQTFKDTVLRLARVRRYGSQQDLYNDAFAVMQKQGAGYSDLVGPQRIDSGIGQFITQKLGMTPLWTPNGAPEVVFNGDPYKLIALTTRMNKAVVEAGYASDASNGFAKIRRREVYLDPLPVAVGGTQTWRVIARDGFFFTEVKGTRGGDPILLSADDVQKDAAELRKKVASEKASSGVPIIRYDAPADLRVGGSFLSWVGEHHYLWALKKLGWNPPQAPDPIVPTPGMMQ